MSQLLAFEERKGRGLGEGGGERLYPGSQDSGCNKRGERQTVFRFARSWL